MGMLAALRSMCTQGITGLMVTASHNPVHENGVKVADPNGGMLNVLWEPYSDLLANAPNVEKLLQVLGLPHLPVFMVFCASNPGIQITLTSNYR